MIRHRQLSGPDGYPATWEIVEGADEPIDSVCAWFAEHKPAVDEVVAAEGALLLRGFHALREASDFDKAIRAVSPRLRDYVGGTSPRERVLGRIMTATSTPPDWSIPLHQEMAYTTDPPARIAFFCRRPADSGGLSTLGDMGKVLGLVPAHIRDKAEAHGFRLRRTLPSERTAHRKPGVKKVWSEVFGTTDRAEVDRLAAAKNWETRWLDEDTVQLYQEILPATRRHPVSGKEVWFNQAHFFAPACMMAWAEGDAREQDWKELDAARHRDPELLDDILYGNGETITDDDALTLYDLLKSVEVPLALRASELLIVDNTLVAHGRTAFTGQRDILVALINDERGPLT
ncbi:TauD/TfdA family dioxygenase [Amycolatopsis sp. NPDC051716]|jgi:alpha-ketoglutarate-dependent taurine dioxygenase|uniref:TauD/TfdA family dioxygenase n=1 Tax=Amycolatopsis sp. NPDC051716 TaxID=3155804 RepID=UPI00341CB242